VALGLGLILLGVLAVSASTTTPSDLRSEPSAMVLQTRSFSDEAAALDSLRADVARHPEDFMTFETRIAANRFIAEHQGAYHETESRVIERGVVGYWLSKTLVVVPSLSLSDRMD
jgi:hypothetical protein